MSVPDLFRCPITLDIFVDPVTLSTGQTYDRSSIEKWLEYGNTTCPVTMQKLHDLSLVPNHTLRHLIDQWLLHSSTELSHTFESKPASDDSLATIKANLQSSECSVAVKIEALRRVTSLSKESDSRRACLIHQGFYSLLLDISLNSHSKENNTKLENSELVEEALQCVVNLSPCRTKVSSLDTLKEESRFSSLCSLFDLGSMRMKTTICYLIEAISSDMDYQELTLLLGQTPSILQSIISLLEQSYDPTAADAAVRALSGLCRLLVIQEKVVREGGIQGLIMYISNTERRLVSKALATLETLLGLDTSREALMRNPKAVHVLVKKVFRVSDHDGSENAVSSLLILCCGSLVLRKEAVRAGVVTQLLLLLQSQCSGRAKSKARKLLKMVRTLWTEHPRFFDLVWFR